MPIQFRKALQQIQNYVPARTLESVKRELGLTDVIKLAGNENNHGCSSLVSKAIAKAYGELARYPDMYATQLREALSQKLHIQMQQLIFGNGSFELISLLAQTFLEEGDEVIIPTPTFGWYQTVSLGAGATVISLPLTNHAIDLGDVAAAITVKSKIIWLCNPNNPTGTYFNHDSLKQFLQTVPPHVLVVLDEAYYELADAPDFPDSLRLLNEYPNTIVLRTFSKVYGLASMRLGYGIAAPELILAIEKIKPPINVNMPVQVAALAALQDEVFAQYVVQENRQGKELYYRTLTELQLPYLPTQGNFIMFDTGLDSSFAVEQFLRQGILVRGGAEFGMPTWLRISIGKQEENQKVLTVLRHILNTTKESDHLGN